MITLVVSSSFGKLSCGIFRGNEVLFTYGPEKLFNTNLGETVKDGLTAAGLAAGDLDRLVVDVGPGGTSSVRTGVAFINGLGYSLNIPVYAVSSLECLWAMARNTTEAARLIALANSLGDTLYLGTAHDHGFTVQYANTDGFLEMVTSGGATALCGDPSVIKKMVAAAQERNVALTAVDISTVDVAVLLRLSVQPDRKGRRYPDLPIPLAELLAAEES